MSDQRANPYVNMPMERVQADALYGVRLAREAWQVRDPEGSAKELEQIIEPGQAEQTRPVLTAAGDFLKQRQGSKARRWKQQ
jgi:hypothetical protein